MLKTREYPTVGRGSDSFPVQLVLMDVKPRQNLFLSPTESVLQHHFNTVLDQMNMRLGKERSPQEGGEVWIWHKAG